MIVARMIAVLGRRELGLAGILLWILCAILIPLILPGFLVYQISLALTYAIAILGLNLLLGCNGQISMAQGVFFAVGGYTSAILVTRTSIHALATLPIDAVITGVLGFLVGIPALRLQGLQLAITTLGLAAIVPPLALKLDWITNGASGISFDKPDPPGWFPGNQDVWIYVLCVLGATICVAVMHRLLRGDSGRSFRAVRDNPLIAAAHGIDLTKVRLAAFVTSACFAGFGGGLFALVNGYVSPESFQVTLSLNFLVGAVVGGITSIQGAFIGALFVVFVPDWAGEVSPALAALIYAVCLIGLMLVARDGVVGIVRSLLARLTQPTIPERPRALPTSPNEL
jgi:branched-chain amino acid transport system permease protein